MRRSDEGTYVSALRPRRQSDRRRLLRLFGMLVLVLLGQGLPYHAAAQDETNAADESWSDGGWSRVAAVESLSGQELPNALRIRGSWMTSSGDMITFVDDSGNSVDAHDPRAAVNFTNSTWLFDAGNRGKASLILRFRPEGAGSAAYLWDDQDGDGQVGYHFLGHAIEITESPHWTMKLSVNGDWLRPDGGLNYAVTVLLDGCGACNYPPEVLAKMTIDGIPDFRAQFFDLNEDGIPEYTLSEMETELPPGQYQFNKFGVQSNEGQLRPRVPENTVLWPWLAASPTPYGDLESERGRMFETPPFVPVDWTTAKAGVFGSVGYPIENGYWINSYAQVDEVNQPLYANFENPMAYYDLAQDLDGAPELHVRLDYFKADDPLIAGEHVKGPAREDVRYSWSQRDNHGNLVWDYKLGLLGEYEVTETDTVGDGRVLTVPWRDLPAWVVSKEWGILSFVAAETSSYQSSEGIYEWSPRTGITYLNGISTRPPAFNDLRLGYRGEYRNRTGMAELSFSPVDRRLHLFGAEGGQLALDDQTEMRYTFSKVGYIDGWQLWRSGRILAQLYRVPGGLVYSGDDGTFFREVELPNELFRTLPPTNHDEWERLDEQLDANGLEPPVDNLRAMFDQFDGDPIELADQPLSVFQRTNDGASIVVDAGDEATRKMLQRLTSTTISDGLQLVTYTASRWDVRAATYAAPQISIVAPQQGALQTVPVQVAVANPGALPLTKANLLVQAVSSDGSAGVTLGIQPLDVQGNGTQTISFDWAPGRSDRWTIHATISTTSVDPRNGTIVLLAQQDTLVDVPPTPVLTRGVARRLGWEGTTLAQGAVLVALLLLTGTGAALVLVRRT